MRSTGAATRFARACTTSRAASTPFSGAGLSSTRSFTAAGAAWMSPGVVVASPYGAERRETPPDGRDVLADGFGRRLHAEWRWHNGPRRFLTDRGRRRHGRRCCLTDLGRRRNGRGCCRTEERDRRHEPRRFAHDAARAVTRSGAAETSRTERDDLEVMPSRPKALPYRARALANRP